MLYATLSITLSQKNLDLLTHLRNTEQFENTEILELKMFLLFTLLL